MECSVGFSGLSGAKAAGPFFGARSSECASALKRAFPTLAWFLPAWGAGPQADDSAGRRALRANEAQGRPPAGRRAAAVSGLPCDSARTAGVCVGLGVRSVCLLSGRARFNGALPSWSVLESWFVRTNSGKGDFSSVRASRRPESNEIKQAGFLPLGCLAFCLFCCDQPERGARIWLK